MLSWLVGDDANAKRIQVSGNNDKHRDFKIYYFDEEGAGLHNSLYKQLVNKKSIVFERSRTGTEDTAKRINERNQLLDAKFPVKVRTHHSSVSKRLREDAEGSIKQNNESSLNAIISTSTLELGIDIGDLDQVIQVGGLNSSGSFLQRVGRTGRRPGQPQYFRGMCAEPEELVLLAACVNLGMERVSENILFPHKAYHILAHQVICLCLQKQGTTADAMWTILSTASCFSAISRQRFEELISYMVKEDFIRVVNGNVLLTGTRTETEFLRANWKRLFAIFDTGVMYNVVDGKKVIGTLDSAFARARELPFVFVLGGHEWNAIKIDHELQQVLVKRNSTGIAPRWKGIANFDIPFELAQEVGSLLMTDTKPIFMDPLALKILQMERNTYKELDWEPGKWILDELADSNKYYLWTFCGEKINRSLVLLFEDELEIVSDYDYKRVSIDFGKSRPLAKPQLLDLISSFKYIDKPKMEEIAIKHVTPKWFSKFSECLPPSLTIQTILDKDYDFQGLIREFEKNEFE